MGNTLSVNNASSLQNRAELSADQQNAIVTLFPDIATLTDDNERNKFLNNIQNFATREIGNLRKENDQRTEEVLEKAKNDAKKMEEFKEQKQSYKENNETKIAYLQTQLNTLNEENKILSTNERWPIAQFKYATIFDRQAKKLESFEQGTKGAQEAMRYAYYSTYKPGIRHLARALNKSWLPFTREDPKKVAERFKKMIEDIKSKADGGSPRQQLVVKKLGERYAAVYKKYAEDYNQKYGIQSSL